MGGRALGDPRSGAVTEREQPLRTNARIVGADPDLVARELEQVGAQKPGQHIMWQKAAFQPIKLEGLSCVAANVLKQEMLARGGDCAVHRDCLTLDREQSDVLLLGTRAQYRELTEKLKEQAFGLPEAGQQIAELLERIDAKPAPLRVGNYALPLGER